MLENFTNQIIRYKWLVLLLTISAVCLSAIGFKHLTILTDYDVFFDGENERLVAHRNIEADYGRRDTVQFAIEFKNGNVFEVQNLAIIETLTEESWKVPHSRRVDSLTNFPYTRANEDEFVVSALFEDPLSLTKTEIEERRRFAHKEPSLINVINQDERVSGLQIWINLPKDKTTATKEVSEYVRSLAARFTEKYEGINIYVSGSVLLSEAFFEASTKGTARVLAIMFVISLLMVGLLLRSVVATFATLLLTIFSVICGLGVATWIGLPFTAPSSSAPIIIMVLTVANAVHIMTTMLTRMRTGESKYDSIIYTVNMNFQAVFLTSLTTIIGFLCLNTSTVPPYRFLGTTTALGVISCFVLTFTLLPALLAAVPVKVMVKKTHRLNPDEKWLSFGNFLIRNKNSVALVTALSILLTVPFIGFNKVDDRLITYFDRDVPFRSHSDFTMERIAPFYTIAYSFTATGSGGITKPEYLSYLEKYTGWARSQPEVFSVYSLSDTIKRINRTMHGDDEFWYKIPQEQELASQYLLLYELSLPYGLDLTSQIDIDKSATKVVVGFHDISSARMREFETKAERWMKKNMPTYMITPATGPPLLFAHIWDSATRSNIVGMGLAVLLISIVIAITMKSVSVGLISLVPNIIPALMAFGVWGIINGQIDIGSSIVAVVSFGIIVDDTIHFLSKYQKAIKDGHTAEQAVCYAFTSVGRALLFTSIVLFVGFYTLTLSSFTLNSSMGLLTAISIAFALYFDFFLLPLLLIWVDKLGPVNVSV